MSIYDIYEQNAVYKNKTVASNKVFATNLANAKKKKTIVKPPVIQPKQNLFQKLGTGISNIFNTPRKPLDMMGGGVGKSGMTKLSPVSKLKTVGVGKTGAVKIAPRTYSSADAILTGALDSASLGLVNSATNKLTGNKGNMAVKGHETAYNVGKLLGYGLPISKASKALKPVLKSIKNPIANRVIEGGLINGGMFGINDAAEGKSKKEILNNAKWNIGIGAAADVGLLGAGKLISKGLSKFNKPIQATLPKVNSNQVKFNNTQSRLKSLMGTKEIPKIEPVKAYNKIVPINSKLVPKGNIATGKGKFVNNSIKNSEVATETMKNSIVAPPYMKVNNKDTWNEALKKVEDNHLNSITEFTNTKELRSADDTALGQALIVKAIKEGKIADANELSINLAEKLSKAGQSVQAAAIFKKLSPEGMLQYANGVVNRVNKAIESGTGLKDSMKKVKLSEAEANKILQGMKEYSKMPDGNAKDIKIAQIMQVINDKKPSTLVDKIRAARNISLLGNAKTQVRNVVGNGIMGVADNTSNVLGTPLDKLISLKTKQRAVGLPSLGIQAKGFVKGIKNATQDSFGGITLDSIRGKSFKEKVKILSDGFTNPINRDLNGNGKFETGNRLAFKNKPMRIAENLVGTSLKIGDNSFKTAYTDDILNQLMKTNKVTTATDEMKAIAGKIADERTYQDNNGLTKLAMGIKNLPQKLENGKARDAAQIFVDSQLPFVRTPANLLKRATEYTPLGIIDGSMKLNKMLKVGSKSGIYDMAKQRAGVDRISRGIVGTGVGALGALSAKAGLLTGAADKDRDMAAMDAQTGKQPYSFKLPNGQYYNYAWAQPMSMPLSGGVQMMQGKKGQPIKNLKDSAENALNFYTDQPMLQSIQKLLGSQYDSKGIGQRLTDAALTVPNQFVPTALKQVTQMIDPNVRSNYSPDSLQKSTLNPIKSKVPGLSNKLPVKYDTLGREVKQFQGKNNLFNVALNPGNLTTDKTTPIEKLITETYKATGDTTIFPRVVPQYLMINKQRYDLTGKEYAEFQQMVGQGTSNVLNEQLSTLQNLDVDSRAKALQKIIKQVYDGTKKLFIEYNINK